MIEYIVVIVFSLLVGYIILTVNTKHKEEVYIDEDYFFHIRIEEIKPKDNTAYSIVNARLIDRQTGGRYEKVYYGKRSQSLKSYADLIKEDYRLSNDYLRASRESEKNNE